MAKITYTQAIRDAQYIELKRDPNVFIIGQDVGAFGSAFGQTNGLQKEFGADRILDAPITETAITGMAVGAASVGLRPIVVHDFMDFMGVCMDEVLNQMAKLSFMVGGQTHLPIVVRTQGGGGISAAAQHSQSVEVFFTHMPGLKVVAGATPADIKGLIASAVRDENPVIVVEHKKLGGLEGEVPDGEYLVPIGKANVVKEGDDVTLLTWSAMAHTCESAAKRLESDGISVEVIDIRTLVPLDKEAIFNSLKKTSRLVIAHEAIGQSGYGAEIAAVVSEEAFDLLDAPIKRVTAPFTHSPFSPVLESEYVPNEDKVIQAIKSLI
jgi:pyruvate dehydrogenase E1 component beta subunit